jgi:hypothetical protein
MGLFLFAHHFVKPAFVTILAGSPVHLMSIAPPNIYFIEGALKTVWKENIEISCAMCFVKGLAMCAANALRSPCFILLCGAASANRHERLTLETSTHYDSLGESKASY